MYIPKKVRTNSENIKKSSLTFRTLWDWHQKVHDKIEIAQFPTKHRKHIESHVFWVCMLWSGATLYRWRRRSFWPLLGPIAVGFWDLCRSLRLCRPLCLELATKPCHFCLSDRFFRRKTFTILLVTHWEISSLKKNWSLCYMGTHSSRACKLGNVGFWLEQMRSKIDGWLTPSLEMIGTSLTRNPDEKFTVSSLYRHDTMWFCLF